MTGYTVTDVENAIISTLKNDATIAAYVRTVDRMPIEDNKMAQKLILKYPAILVIYAGGTDNLTLYPTLDHTAKFSIWCVDKSVREISAASVGVYKMLNDILNALHDKDFGLDNIINSISTGVSFIDADEKITIFSREFDVTWRYK